MLKLKAKIKDFKIDNQAIRKMGEIPAVFYGPKQKSTSITVNEKDFQKIWKEAGESTTIFLETPNGEVETLIHEVQFHPVINKPIHIDFFAIDVTKEIEVKIPLEFIGISPAIKNGLGILVKVLHELEIKSLPKNLPNNFQIDITKLVALEDQIIVKDVKLPDGVSLITNEEEVIALISAFKEEKEEKEEISIESIEVEKKGKIEDPEADIKYKI